MVAAYLLMSLFCAWMIYDAIAREAELYWYLVIILVPPFGAFVYFLVVKLKDYDLGRFSAARLSGFSLSKLERQAAASSDPEDALALADALEQRGRCGQAQALYERVLAEQPGDPRALHGLGRCHLETNRPTDAVDALERVVSRDRTHDDYRAALHYAEALWRAGREDEAVELLEALAELTGRFNHRLALAHYAALLGRTGRANQVVDALLSEFEQADEATRKRHAKWARTAARLKRRVSSS
jgi:hypothetical protein